MADKKVLIIAYYWPPSGGSGVQRWLKFVKYLPQFGWNPFVFTPENPSVVVQDNSLINDVPAEAEIVKLPIWEPYESFAKLSKLLSGGKQSAQKDFIVTKKTSLFQRLSIWVRGNLFIPDPRKFWVKPATAFLTDYLKENNIGIIITTGPPHSMHLIGLRLKQQNPSLKWIADMRDPWSEWGFLDSIKAGNYAKSKHRKLEKKVLTTADEVITITPFYVRQFERISERKVHLLTNGFDDDDFKNFALVRSDKFLIRHIGIVNEKCDPRPFMKAFGELCTENAEIRNNSILEFVGQVNPVFREFVERDKLLSSITKFTNAVAHNELLNIYSTSSLLVLILTGYKDAEGYMPGKLFEYLATGLPVLGVGPVNGDADHLLNSTQAGQMINGDDTNKIKQYILQCFDDWNRNAMKNQNPNSNSYSRKGVTGKLVDLLNTKI